MHIPAKVDYGMRALLELAASDGPATGEVLARAQDLPPKFLAAIMNDLRRAGLVQSQRGLEGGTAWAGRRARSPQPTSCGRWMGPWPRSEDCGPR